MKEEFSRNIKIGGYCINLVLPLQKVGIIMRGPTIQKGIEFFERELQSYEWQIQDEILDIIKTLKKGLEFKATLTEIESKREQNLVKIMLFFDTLEEMLRFQEAIL